MGQEETSLAPASDALSSWIYKKGSQPWLCGIWGSLPCAASLAWQQTLVGWPEATSTTCPSWVEPWSQPFLEPIRSLAFLQSQRITLVAPSLHPWGVGQAAAPPCCSPGTVASVPVLPASHPAVSSEPSFPGGRRYRAQPAKCGFAQHWAAQRSRRHHHLAWLLLAPSRHTPAHRLPYRICCSQGVT